MDKIAFNPAVSQAAAITKTEETSELEKKQGAVATKLVETTKDTEGDIDIDTTARAKGKGKDKGKGGGLWGFLGKIGHFLLDWLLDFEKDEPTPVNGGPSSDPAPDDKAPDEF